VIAVHLIALLTCIGACWAAYRQGHMAGMERMRRGIAEARAMYELPPHNAQALSAEQAAYTAQGEPFNPNDLDPQNRAVYELHTNSGLRAAIASREFFARRGQR
jgi:hypothetical protein